MDVLNIWTLQGQLFVLLAVGAALRHFKVLGESSKAVLTDLVLYVTLPCSIILSFQIELTSDLFLTLALVLAVSLAIQLFSLLLSRTLFSKSEESKAKAVGASGKKPAAEALGLNNFLCYFNPAPIT